MNIREIHMHTFMIFHWTYVYRLCARMNKLHLTNVSDLDVLSYLFLAYINERKDEGDRKGNWSFPLIEFLQMNSMTIKFLFNHNHHLMKWDVYVRICLIFNAIQLTDWTEYKMKLWWACHVRLESLERVRRTRITMTVRLLMNVLMG